MSFASAAIADAGPQQRLDGILRLLAAHEITSVEILHVPKEVLTRTRLTRDMLERQYSYKIAIRDIRATPHESRLIRALQTTKVAAQRDSADLRWAVLFYASSGARVEGLYLNGRGDAGAVSDASASFSFELIKWLERTFGACFSAVRAES